MSTTLHILYPAALPDSLRRLWSAGDSLLLAGASVTLAFQGSAGELPTPTYALADAVQARGLAARWPTDRIPLLSATDWVRLVTRHDKSLSWS